MVFLLGLQAEVPSTAAVFSELRAVKDYFSCTAVLNVYLMNFAGRVASILLSTIPKLTVGVLEPHVLKKPVISVVRFLLTRKRIHFSLAPVNWGFLYQEETIVGNRSLHIWSYASF